MKTNLKLLGSVLAVFIAVTACDKTSLTRLPDQEDPNVDPRDDSSAINDSLVLGNLIIKPLTGSLDKSGEREILKQGDKVTITISKARKGLFRSCRIFQWQREDSLFFSFSIILSFYSDLENGPVDEEYSVVFHDGDRSVIRF